MDKNWQILARHCNKWVAGATITESRHIQPPAGQELRQFTATIRGWGNWRIWRGDVKSLGMEALVAEVKRRATAIRARIDRDDESVFHEPGAW
jgi:hypothetical protein